MRARICTGRERERERERTGTVEDAQTLRVCGNNFTVKPTVIPARFEVLTEV